MVGGRRLFEAPLISYFLDSILAEFKVGLYVIQLGNLIGLAFEET